MDQKQLNAFIKRRHPRYKENEAHWQFLNACYAGGRTWFDQNIFVYHKEGENEFKARRDRAYRFNHTKEIVDLVGKYIFKVPASRQEDAPEIVKSFWKRATRNGLDIGDYMRQIERKASIFGRVWVVVDSTKEVESDNRAEEKASDARIISYVVEPYNMLDMSYDENQELKWALIAEYERDDADPFTSSGAMLPRFRLWTRDGWILFKATPKSGTDEFVVEKIGEGEHDLGVVPVFAADNIASDDPYVSPALIGDIAYLDRAVANYLSNLDAIIQDQTFSQLAMPAQGMMPGDEAYKKVLELGTKRIFIYDGEGGAQPFYLSPDIKQAQLILDVINKIINEIYHSVGVAGERTKQDNALGIDNSSGVAKAYDFERVNALLASKADSLEMVENRLVKLVMAWAGETYDEENPMVEYPDNFDVRGLYDEFEIAARLAAIDAPDEVRREQMKLVIDKLFPKLKGDLKKKMLEELKQWPPKLDAMLETMGANSISSESMSGAGESPAGDTSTNPGQPT